MPRDLSHVPPIGDRPRCKGCGRRLLPVSYPEYQRIERPLSAGEQEQLGKLYKHGGTAPTVEISSKFLGRKFHHWKGDNGFHSLRCALDFAVAAHNAGFRRTKP